MPYPDAKYPPQRKVIPSEAAAGISLSDGPLLKTAEAAALLGLSVKTMRQYRYEGVGPRCFKMGSNMQARARYLRSDLEQWVRDQSRTAGGEQQ